MDTTQALEKILAGSGMYGFLSAAFLYPDADTLSDLAASREDARAALGVLGCSTSLTEALESLNDRLGQLTASDLEEEYIDIFGHTISKICPPYETEYGQDHIFQQAQALADIGGFFKAFGLEPADEDRERPDHISVELEFMSFLAHKEANALASQGQEQVEICQEAQRNFLRDHLGRWVPLFAARLNDSAGEGFYRDLIGVASAFLDFEAEAKGATASQYEERAPRGIEPEEDCSDCSDRNVCLPPAGIDMTEAST